MRSSLVSRMARGNWRVVGRSRRSRRRGRVGCLARFAKVCRSFNPGKIRRANADQPPFQARSRTGSVLQCRSAGNHSPALLPARTAELFRRSAGGSASRQHRGLQVRHETLFSVVACHGRLVVEGSRFGFPDALLEAAADDVFRICVFQKARGCRGGRSVDNFLSFCWPITKLPSALKHEPRCLTRRTRSFDPRICAEPVSPRRPRPRCPKKRMICPAQSAAIIFEHRGGRIPPATAGRNPA